MLTINASGRIFLDGKDSCLFLQQGDSPRVVNAQGQPYELPCEWSIKFQQGDFGFEQAVHYLLSEMHQYAVCGKEKDGEVEYWPFIHPQDATELVIDSEWRIAVGLRGEWPVTEAHAPEKGIINATAEALWSLTNSRSFVICRYSGELLAMTMEQAYSHHLREEALKRYCEPGAASREEMIARYKNRGESSQQHPKISHEQFEAVAQAIRMQKMSKGRQGAYKVLVGGMRPSDAARVVGITQSSLNEALSDFRRGLAVAETTARGLSERLVDHQEENDRDGDEGGVAEPFPAAREAPVTER